ncbi:efflux RND transporter periplasmic adaptor subunit [Methylobacterium sp. 77]|uniref:efflux RND transporter periplasmic adaptor subunit n=1 Tax=Methylobacterium sp. 77 TaxID=1101192 RepID=UPI00036C4F33|nr:efflux RND transporter periplasmic adaptor subunit [Methylobacterium sp. 77]
MADDDLSDASPSQDTSRSQARSPSLARRRLWRVLRLLATVVILACAGVAAALVWQFYVTAPWTRDGRVRVQVASVAPQVSGQIVELRVTDNQNVAKGDVLYVIDPVDFDIAIATAQAELENREADLQVKRTQAARREALTTLSTSVEEKQQYAGTAKIAEAALASAKAQLNQAQVNRRRTEVRSPVNGRVTNLLLRAGDYATAGTVNVAVIDTDSFWIDGYFEETKMAHIHVGDTAKTELLGYAPLIDGTVESITLGISNANASPSTQGLPNVDPVYTWVRLAQRIPVRIRIDRVPKGVTLVAGMNATVSVGEPGAHGGTLWRSLRDRFAGTDGPASTEPRRQGTFPAP